jgi:hypothetical protein
MTQSMPSAGWMSKGAERPPTDPFGPQEPPGQMARAAPETFPPNVG